MQEEAASARDEERELIARLLARRLRDARIEAELQLTEAAERAGVSKQHLNDCEHARRIPSLPTLADLADAYGMLATELLDGVYPFGSRNRPEQLPPPPSAGRSRHHPGAED